MFFLIEFDRRGHRLRFFIQLAQLIAYLTFGLERQIRPRADAKRHYRRFLLAENVERRVSVSYTHLLYSWALLLSIVTLIMPFLRLSSFFKSIAYFAVIG